MLVEGRVQKSPEGVVHLMAGNIIDRTAELEHLWDAEGPEPALARRLLAHADEGQKLYPPVDALMAARPMIPAPLHLAPPPRHRHPRNARILPRSRDFH
jgi:error-prone DNA polymerase